MVLKNVLKDNLIILIVFYALHVGFHSNVGENTLQSIFAFLSKYFDIVFYA